MSVSETYFLVSDEGEKTEVAHNTLVGRHADCEIALDDNVVSRQHARFLVSTEGLTLIDLNSRNGTFVQDVQIKEATLLPHGTKIRIGSYSRTVVCEPAKGSAGDRGNTPPDAGSPDADTSGSLQDTENDSADKGVIEVGPRNENLPPAWYYNEDAHTSVLKESDREKVELEQQKVNQDLTLFEANIDAPTLVVATGPEAGTPYRLKKTSEDCFWTIGRGSDNLNVSITLDDSSVSTLHAKISYKSGRWKIADQMSTNKTYVNGEQFNAAFLSSRDAVRLGSMSLLFLLPAQPEAEEQPAQQGVGLWGGIKRLFNR